MSDGKSRVRKPLKSRASAQQHARASGASEETPTANALVPAEAQIGECSSERGAEEPRIVCLGASAGGLEALDQFFRGIPPNTGAAFIAILHLAGDFKNVMTELLARYTTMRIKSVTATTLLEPNVVYVIRSTCVPRASHWLSYAA
jgi:two-component system CheB/CheR fusion protein